jgi:hypothetical protein
VTIDGFTIDGGNSVVGLACEGSDPTIQNNVFRNCVGPYDGGATWFNYCAPKILDNLFHDNTTPISGAAVFVRLGIGYGTAVVTGNTMYNNVSGNGPAVSLIEGDDAIVSYNIAYDNIATPGSQRRGAIYVRGIDLDIHNNTADGNTVGVSVLSSTNVDVRNNIISASLSVGLEYLSDVGANSNVTNDFNDVWNNAGGDYYATSAGINGISADPQFVAGFNLGAGSPCINSGDPDPAFNDQDGTRNDMGAIPGATEGPYALNLNLGDGVSPVAVGTLTPTIYWSYFDNDPTSQGAYEIEVGTDNDWAVAEMWSGGPVNSADTAALYDGSPLSNHSTYYLRMRLSDGVDFGPWSTLAFTITIPGTIHVPADFATIQEVFDAAASGDSIIVSPGTYVEALSVNAKSVIIKSEYGPQVTTITEASNVNLVTFSNDGGYPATVDGFTLSGGRIVGLCVNAGPVISHNMVHDQSISNWGAISLGGSGYATNGPSPAVIVNNTIVGCANGAISTFSTVEPIIRNNILAFNGHYAIHRNSTSPTYPHPVMEYNCVYGNAVAYQNITPGTGVITVDPLLDSDFLLTNGSPCIDAGDPDPSFNDPDGTRNDIGGAPYDCNELPGDVNRDSKVTIGDVVHIISYLFTGGAAPACEGQADVDASGQITIGDVTYLINWMFVAGQSPQRGP